MLEIRRLRLLRELSIRGTLAGVAEALAYSPSSVSQQLALLEKEAGVELMRKSGRGVVLTPAAEVLVGRTEELLAALERTEAELAASESEVQGTVRVAVFQTAVLALMPTALRTLRERHPLLRVEMVQHEPETALRETWARSFDVVVAEHYPHHAAPHYPGLDRERLTEDAIRLALPPAGAGPAFDAARRLSEAAHLPWVMEPHGAASRHWAEQACRAAGFEPDVRYETADLQAHVRLVESGNAVALLPDLVWAGRLPAARLVTLDGAPQRVVFTSVRASGARSPVMLAVRQALEEAAHTAG
ncbi:LysR family transcriptional regulator [Sinomonas sp. ASV486]|uniref:LysR family transcriptional regulator n=1 Tax=Sinomonas sp. ASV486 TaxID=3051170 RepID=UPI0027DC0037|nr:LysR family transcriptional regulator [Sinomonas sp. ASV486]MDQ4491323.1 LysR family transcriptional regulator [Sinomonas sp. ASV486]